MVAVSDTEPAIVIQQFATPIIGTSGDDNLSSGAQDDVIVGLQGNDTLSGFAGNDLLMGNAGQDILVGDVGNDNLSGASGNDFLDGGGDGDSLNGGSEADTMMGGSGNDSYVVDNPDDVVDEGTNLDPNDTVYSYIDYQLPTAIEDLTLLGNDKTTGTGNDTGNVIIGNSGNNILQGRDPVDTHGLNSGDIDTLAGGLGDDKYNVDDSLDVVVERPNQGTDTVESYVSYILADNVENLSFVGEGPPPGTTIVGIGNDLDNTFRGNPGDNLFQGLGGNDLFIGGSGGTDTYEGGTGNDRFIVYDASLDLVSEEEDSGIDEVKSYTENYFLTANVENLILGSPDDQGRAGVLGFGNDRDNFLQGNELDNTLSGQARNDYLIGAQGNDFLNGGTGNDTFLFRLNDGQDTVVDSEGEHDAVRFDKSLQQDQIAMFFNQAGQLQFGNTVNTLDTITIQNQSFSTSSIEQFDLQNGLFMDTGDTQRVFQAMQAYANQQGIALNSLDDVQSNPTLMNILSRGWRGGQNISQSGTVDGVVLVSNFPLLVGTFNDDVLVGFNSATYFGFGGNDLIMAGDQTDFINGGDGNDIMNGGGGDDNLVGGNGNDVLNGGAGVDTMQGGTGNDTYLVDRYSIVPFQEQDRDQVIEDSDSGVDTVESFTSYYELPANVENLIIKGDASGPFFGGEGATGVGNILNNQIIGNDKGNWLYGAGGEDILQGGGGSDTYLVNSTADQVIEAPGQGDLDRIRAYVDYTLPDNVENLYLIGETGMEPLQGFGNNMDNVIVGNNGSNFISGGDGNDQLYSGAGGMDTLQGNAGDDVYGIGNNTVTINEDPDQGTDTAAINIVNVAEFTLPDNVENLILDDPIEGPIPDSIGNGNERDNFMQGGRGRNTLNGLAGDDYLIGAQGNDTLNGGSGNDTFLFREGDGADVVSDAAGVQDRIRFNNSVAQDNIIVFRDNNDPGSTLQIGYVDNTTDQIIVSGQTENTTSIERFELQDGLFMDAEDMNKVISAMSQYAEINGVTFDSLQSVRDNADLISIVNGGWHA